MELKIENFERNPLLKKLLTNYCLRQYEEDAITDDEHLDMEWNLLKRNNQLEELFICEHMDNDCEDNYTG